MEKIIGKQGGIINYPLALVTMNFIFHQEKLPAGVGQKSRTWFSTKMPEMIRVVKKWDASVPKSVFYDVPEIDRTNYDMLMSHA